MSEGYFEDESLCLWLAIARILDLHWENVGAGIHFRCRDLGFQLETDDADTAFGRSFLQGFQHRIVIYHRINC